ncbi:MAG TPA: hypothetical protein VEH07_04385 [Alphaproteobacteria bacterium]|nr:hypothetical protein [Alphaproteobacteria bacterium]
MAEVYEDPGPGQAQGGTQWSFRDAIAKGIAGSIGILAALVIDYLQKGDSSSLLFATKLVNQAALARFNVSAVPAWIYLVIVLIAGFAMVYIFEPTNKRNAFYAGAGVLGFLATFSPIAQQTLQIPSAEELPSLDSLLQATQTVPDGTLAPATTAPLAPASPAPAPAGKGFAEEGAAIQPQAFDRSNSEMVVAQAQTIPVNIIIVLPAGAKGSLAGIRVMLHEDATGQTKSLDGSGRFAKMGDRLVIFYQTTVMAAGSTSVKVRVEAEGYTITEKPFTITPDMRVARIELPLTPSSTPLAVQRLNYPYRW